MGQRRDGFDLRDEFVPPPRLSGAGTSSGRARRRRSASYRSVGGSAILFSLLGLLRQQQDQCPSDFDRVLNRNHRGMRGLIHGCRIN